MTIDFDESLYTDEKLLSIANYALKLIGRSPYLTDASEISVSFILRLSVEYFGPDLLPHRNGTSYNENCSNVRAVLDRLCSEIGLDLDHINPEDVARGHRRATSNLLELLTAFIAYCVGDDLLIFDNEAQIISVCDEIVPIDNKTGLFVSTSPELPRSTERFHVPAARFQHPVATSHLRSVVEHPHLLHEVFTPDHSTVCTDKPFRDSLDVWPNFALSHNNNVTCPDNRTPSESDHLHLLNRRHPSIFAATIDNSPPTTPKAMDSMMEIIKHSPPAQPPPSLKSSPKCAKSIGDMSHLDNFSNDTSHLIEMASSSDKVSPLTGLRPVRRRKVSSSSSGRGHSPTQTLTVPGASATSTASSLSESLVGPLEKCSPTPTTPDAIVSSNTIPHRCKHKHLRKLTHRPRSISRDSVDSTSTNSICDWSLNDNTASVKTVIDELTSLLSTSFNTAKGHGNDGKILTPRSSASLAITHSKGFTKALKRRLNYLRSVFSRAHTEAVAVSTLVQALGSKNSKHSIPMHRCVNNSEMDDETIPLKSAPLPANVESMLQQILEKLTLLVNQIDATAPNSRHRQFDTLQRRASANHVFAEHTELSSPFTYFCDIQRKKINYDSEFSELLDLKHRMMVDALRLCLSEVSPPFVPSNVSCRSESAVNA